MDGPGRARRETVPVNWALLRISWPVCQQPCSLETKTRKQGRMCIQKVVFLLGGYCGFTVAGAGSGAEVWVSEV